MLFTRHSVVSQMLMGNFNEFAVRNSALKLEWGDLTEPRNFVADLSRTETAIHVEYKSSLPTYYVLQTQTVTSV